MQLIIRDLIYRSPLNRYKFSCFTFSGALQSVGVGIELSFNYND